MGRRGRGRGRITRRGKSANRKTRRCRRTRHRK